MNYLTNWRFAELTNTNSCANEASDPVNDYNDFKDLLVAQFPFWALTEITTVKRKPKENTGICNDLHHSKHSREWIKKLLTEPQAHEKWGY